MISLLRDYFDLQEWDDVRAIREKVTAALLALDHSLGDPPGPPHAARRSGRRTAPGMAWTLRSAGSGRWTRSGGCFQ